MTPTVIPFPRHFMTVCLAVVVLTAWTTSAQEWTRFRGPNGTGISDAKTIPAQWTEGDLNWKVQLPGGGHSSPVVWGDRVFLNCADALSGEFVHLCVSADDGTVLWQHRYPFGSYRIHKFNSFASGTPALDERNVYFIRQNSDRCYLVALTHAGTPVWEFDLGPFDSQHGAAHSPIVYQDLVVVAYDQKGPGRIVAVDRGAGELRWEIPRSAGKADYSVPCLLTESGQPDLLLFNSGEDGINAVEPVTGRVRWKTGAVLDKRSVSSPIFIKGMTFASCGSGGGGNYVVAIEPPPTGQGEAMVKYEVRRSAPYVPAPLIHDDLLFLWSDGGIVTCLDARSGKEHWRERVGGNFFSSPICIDGRIYNASAEGEMVVVQAGPEFEVLGRTDLGEGTRATPAVARGRMYVRTFTHLMSVGGKGAPTSVE